MLYNLKLLGFKAPRAYQCEFGETVREVQEVHEALLRFKTKFHAAFARSVFISRLSCHKLYVFISNVSSSEHALTLLHLFRVLQVSH